MRYNHRLRILIALTAYVLALTAVAEGTTSYTPRLGGVIRARWEGRFDDEGNAPFEQRFQVRNARIFVEGNVAPTISYYARVDLSEKGNFSFLDAWGQWRFAPQWTLRGGRFRVPFGIDCFRGPGTYLFVNRSFLGKHMMNMRQVGARVAWNGTEKVPLTIEAGAFNSGSNTNQTDWHKSLNYAAKATLSKNGVLASLSFITYLPADVRINQYDAALGWHNARWLFEAEYQHKVYTHSGYAPTDGWNVIGRYSLPLRSKVLNTMSVEARYDGMTDLSDGQLTAPADGSAPVLTTKYSRVQRATVGATVAHLDGRVSAEFHLDYEHYFYPSHTAPIGFTEHNVVSAEVVITF